MSDILYHVYQYPGLKETDIEEIIRHHKKRTVRKGDHILKQGQISKSYWILEAGLIRSFVIDTDGNEITTEFYTAGEVVIEVASVFKQEPTQETFQALTDCELWEINFEDFQAVFVGIPAFAEWGRMWMTFALTLQKDRMLNMITQSAQHRYSLLLEQKPMIIQQAPLKYIASYLGVTDTSLSRIRKDILKTP